MVSRPRAPMGLTAPEVRHCSATPRTARVVPPPHLAWLYPAAPLRLWGAAGSGGRLELPMAEGSHVSELMHVVQGKAVC